jgi:hypothetical protein
VGQGGEVCWPQAGLICDPHDRTFYHLPYAKSRMLAHAPKRMSADDRFWHS